LPPLTCPPLMDQELRDALRHIYRRVDEVGRALERLTAKVENLERRKRGAPSGDGMTQEQREAGERVLKYLNDTAGTRFRTTPANLALVGARLREGYTEREILEVVQAKAREAQAGEFGIKYLRPATLFNREKFSQYVGQL